MVLHPGLKKKKYSLWGVPSFCRIVICYVFVWVKYSSQSFCTVRYFILLTFKKEEKKKKEIHVCIDEKVSRKATVPKFVSRLVQVLSVVKSDNCSIWSDSVSHISMLSVDCLPAMMTPPVRCPALEVTCVTSWVPSLEHGRSCTGAADGSI